MMAGHRWRALDRREGPQEGYRVGYFTHKHTPGAFPPNPVLRWGFHLHFLFFSRGRSLRGRTGWRGPGALPRRPSLQHGRPPPFGGLAVCLASFISRHVRRSETQATAVNTLGHNVRARLSLAHQAPSNWVPAPVGATPACLESNRHHGCIALRSRLLKRSHCASGRISSKIASLRRPSSRNPFLRRQLKSPHNCESEDSIVRPCSEP